MTTAVRPPKPALPPADGIEHRIGAILSRRPAIGLAVGVIRNRRLEFFDGHGLADIDSNTPITDELDALRVPTHPALVEVVEPEPITVRSSLAVAGVTHRS